MDKAGVTSIAVIGMACRLPGGIDSPERLWEALLRGDDLVTEVPPDRWDADEYYDPEPGVPGRSVTKWGGFLDDVAGFDSEFFGISEREAIAIDPQHRLLLETSWEAMEHAGFTRETMADSLTGVFVGLTHGDYQLLAADAHAVEAPYGFTGSSFSLASGRIAYALGVHGPALTVDTACSSGLTAVHLACHSLIDGESDLALAGGAAVILDPRKFVAGSAEGMLSPTGRCHAFDVAADGFVSSEGCVVVLLKRLPDALRDGDRILAVIRGTAANQDGHTVNIATPSVTAQTAVYRAALAAAGVDARSIGMVEAHGPGTPVGDPIEYASLAKVYGIEDPCALATVKTNFGHAQSAAGALGLMKTILALQHGVVPQNLHFTRLPDEMARIDTKLFVPQEITPWPTNGHHPRRAAVSSYGLSGTNAHAIVEQAPEQAPEAAAPEDISAESATTAPLLFPLSSTSADELRRTAGRLADWVAAHEDVALPDLAYTLARRRAHRPVRTAVIASSRPELTKALREVADGDTPYQAAAGQDDRGPVWVFSGQGSQWAQMGAELLATEPVFAATVAAAEPLIANESGFSVTEAMTASQIVIGIDRIQPTLFTMQVALAATMRSYGVRPGAVIGHSLGEAAAAVVAGALSLEDGARVICRRSRLMSRIAGAGAMASVELPAQQVLSELITRGVNDAVVAVVASPQSTVIGGATQTVRDLVAAWEQRDVMAREIAVDVASHSPQVDPILDDLTRRTRRAAPDHTGSSLLLGDPVRPARAAGVRCRVLGAKSTPHGAVRPSGAGRFGGGLPGLRGAGAPPAAHACGRADRPQSRHAAGRAGRYAPRASAAIRAAWLCGGSVQCGRRGGLLRAVPEWPAGGRAAADLDSPSAVVEPRWSGFPNTWWLHRFGTSAVGPACALAGGTGAPCLAGRGRHRRPALAGRSPDPQCGCASGGGLLRDGAGGRARCAWRGF